MKERALEIALGWADKNHMRDIDQVLAVSQQIYNFLNPDIERAKLTKTIQELEKTIEELKNINLENLDFEPRDYQAQLLNDLEEHNTVLICHALKIGVTRTLAHYVAQKCQKSKISVLISSNSFKNNCAIQEYLSREFKKSTVVNYRLGKSMELSNGSKIVFFNIEDVDLTKEHDIFWVDNAAFISHQVGDEFYKHFEGCFKKPQKTIFSSSLSDRNGFFYRELKNTDFQGFRTTLRANLCKDESYQEIVKLAQLSNPIEKFSRDYGCS